MNHEHELPTEVEQEALEAPLAALFAQTAGEPASPEALERLAAFAASQTHVGERDLTPAPAQPDVLPDAVPDVAPDTAPDVWPGRWMLALAAALLLSVAVPSWLAGPQAGDVAGVQGVEPTAGQGGHLAQGAQAPAAASGGERSGHGRIAVGVAVVAEGDALTMALEDPLAGLGGGGEWLGALADAEEPAETPDLGLMELMPEPDETSTL